VTVWIDRDRAFVARRYDHLARLITLFEWLLFVPGKFRERAVATLELKPGDRVLEIGCGTGRNLTPATFPVVRLLGRQRSAAVQALKDQLGMTFANARLAARSHKFIDLSDLRQQTEKLTRDPNAVCDFSPVMSTFALFV